jgi:DNA mismatch repair protein MutS
MMQQFEAAKARCPGALVLFRMGDFYELFGDDAREAAALLDLTLTSRDKGPDALPMAGFPHHQLDVQLVKLVAAGRRVAICEQIDGPASADGKPAKGLMRREVTRIVTPGIAADESLLDPDRCNFLVAILPERRRGEMAADGSGDEARGRVGLAWIDVAAGRFEAAVIPRDDLTDHLLRLDPAECLCAERDRPDVEELVTAAGGGRAVTSRPDWWFEPATAEAALARALGGRRLEGLGFEPADDALGIAAAGSVVAYLEENEPAAVVRIDTLAPWRPGLRLEIDEASRRSLELVRSTATGRRDGSLAGVLDRTKTAMGARLLGEWLAAPLVNLLLAWFFRAFNLFFDVTTGAYGAVVGLLLRTAIVVLAAYVGLMALTSLSVLMFFMKDAMGESVLATKVLPAITGLVMGYLFIIIFRDFGALTGTEGNLGWMIPALVPLFALIGFGLASMLASRDPARFKALGNTKA